MQGIVIFITQSKYLSNFPVILVYTTHSNFCNDLHFAFKGGIHQDFSAPLNLAGMLGILGQLDIRGPLKIAAPLFT